MDGSFIFSAAIQWMERTSFVTTLVFLSSSLVLFLSFFSLSLFLSLNISHFLLSCRYGDLIENDIISVHFVERNDLREDEIICSAHIPLSHILFSERECRRHLKRKRERRERKTYESWESRNDDVEEGGEREKREVGEETKTEVEKEEERERIDRERREREREVSKERCWETRREEVIHERGAYVWIQLAANCRLQLKVFLLSSLSPLSSVLFLILLSTVPSLGRGEG